MHRTQLYLDDDLWDTLHARSRTEKTTISELVRQAVRERYLGNHDQRRKAMQDFIGLRRNRSDIPDAVEYIRELRHGDRFTRLEDK